MVEGLLVTWLGLGRAGTVFLPPGGPQKRSGEPSTGWFPFSVCSPFLGGTLRVPFSLRGSPHAARPPLSLRDISPALRGNLPRPRRVYAPASVGALFVRHWRTAPFEKAGETFHVCQSYRTLF